MPTATLPCDKTVEVETAADLCNLLLLEGVRVVTDERGRLIGFAFPFGMRPETEITIETGGEFTRVKIKST